MFNEFYGLTLDPFRLSPDPRFCYRHRNFARAKAYMQYALHQGEGFVMVTGQPGTGKTTLIEDLLADRSTTNVKIARIASTQVAADDLLRLVAAAFGIDTRIYSKATTLLNLQEVLTQQMESGCNSLLIVDEAQNLPCESMEELRMITNLQLGARPLMQVFLVGQDALHALVGQPRMEQLRQRILAASRMEPLGIEDTREYLHHRLRCAGWAGRPGLSGEAVWQIHNASGGIPRRINLLASRLLLHGYIEERLTLDAEDVRLVADELLGELLIGSGGVGDASPMAPMAADTSFDLRHLAIEMPRGVEAAEAVPPEPPAEARPPVHQVQPDQAPAPDATEYSAASGGPSNPGARLLPAETLASELPGPGVALQPGITAPQYAPAEPAVDRVPHPSLGEHPAPAVPVAPTFRSASEQAAARVGDRATGASPQQIRPASTPTKRRGRRFWVWVATAAVLIAVSSLVVLAVQHHWIGQATEQLRPMIQKIDALGAKVQVVIEDSATVFRAVPPDVSLPESSTGTLRKDEPAPAVLIPIQTRPHDLVPPEPAGASAGQASVSVETGEKPAPARTPGAPELSGAAEAILPITAQARTPTDSDEAANEGRPHGAEGVSKEGSTPGRSIVTVAVADKGPAEFATGAQEGTERVKLPEVEVPESAALEDGPQPPAPTANTKTAVETPPAGAWSMIVSEPNSKTSSAPGPVGTQPEMLVREIGVAGPSEGAGAGTEGDLATLEARLVALGFRPVRTDGGASRLILGRELMFDHNSAEITPQARRSVARLIQELADHPHLNLRVIGHTDESGPADYNTYLSLLRAKAFAAILTTGGVPVERITVEGRGEDEPLTRHAVDGIPAHLINRRIELVIRSATPP